MWLQLSFSDHEARRAPGSVFVFRCYVPDRRKARFDLLDDTFPGCIAIRLGEVGLVADLLDHHFHWDAAWCDLAKYVRIPLHYFQFREIAARIFYAARLLGLQTEVSDHRKGDGSALITFKTQSRVAGSHLFWKWNAEEYAKVLAFHTNLPLEKVWSRDGGAWTWLQDKSGNLIDLTKKRQPREP